MNTVYLMRDEKRDACLFKVGFTKDLNNRKEHYTTHNPLVDCISYMHTYKKTGRELETALHREIINRGYKFVSANMDGKTTEWFAVDYNDPFYNELNEKGLAAFDVAATRKNLGCYVAVK